MLVMVVFVALLAYYSIRMVGKTRGMRPKGTKNLELIEVIGLGAQCTAQIIRAGGQYFLVGVTKERISKLAELDESQINLPEPSALGNSFDKLLQRFLNKDKDASEDKKDE